MIIIKSQKEIELMREAGKMLNFTLRTLEKSIKPGMSTLDIDRIGEETIRSFGCVPSFLNYNGFPASICMSVNDEVVHGIPSKHRILKEGDIVSLDAGLIYKGYHSDAARTVGVGEISEEAKLLIERTRMSFFEGMKYILSVPSSTFDSSKTREMAAEVARLNNRIKEEGASYLLLGPGRWGSSDPWLGIPVAWSDISEARMIVETAIPGYRIEPSQGTHFFQNITSLGVGYLTIDTVYGDGTVNEELISGFECVENGEFVKLYKAPEGFIGYIDRNTNRSVIGYK